MARDAFSHVRAWVFDLDNTLYPPQIRLFDQIEKLMTAYVSEALGVSRDEADHLRGHYWTTYGTTLAGLMAEHDLDPEPYLVAVHDIDMSVLSPDPDLASAITDLQGRKIVYTNGSAPYAERVLDARGLSGIFDAVYGVEHAGYRPKPEAEAFARVFAIDGIDPRSGAMFEDDVRNLAAPHAMGMRTVHVAPAPSDEPHVEFHAGDLTAFLSQFG